MANLEFIKTQNRAGGTQYRLNCDGFTVSYVPNTSMGMFSGDDGGCSETALCGKDGYLILNGDFRDSYLRLAPDGYAACKQFYEQQSAHAESSWSDALSPTTPKV